MENGGFHAVLLDINMPGMGGIETCRKLRRMAPRLQILMLTVRDGESDKVRALDAGRGRLHYEALLDTRTGGAPALGCATRADALPDMAAAIGIGQIELDPGRRIVRKSNAAVHLTPKAFDLLHYLMAHAGVPLTHARLLRAVWGPEYGGEIEYLRTFIHQLRHRLEDDPAAPEYLLTETGLGYRFREPSAAADTVGREGLR